MTHRPFFSVIIPTYNRADLIMKTLESVFNQTLQDFEIIVVDNCSTDDTVALLKPLIDGGKLHFIRHDKNYERAVSRNTGMAAAKGKFVTLLDSDDIMYPNNLRDAYSFAVKNQNLQVFHNLYELINENGLPIYKYRFPSLKNPVSAIAEGNFMSCIGGFVSDKVYHKFKFDTAEVLQGIEDWEFWLRVLPEYHVGRIDKINSGIVHHKGRSITQFTLKSYIQKKDYVVQKINSDAALKVIYTPYLNAFGASCYLLAASMANSAGLFNEAGDYLKGALRIKPGVLFSFRFYRILAKAVLKTKNRIDE